MNELLVVSAPPSLEPERRYALDVVLSDWLGLQWVLETRARADVLITLATDTSARAVRLPDILFRTAPADWLAGASLPRLPLPRAEPPLPGRSAAPTRRIPVLYGTIHDGDPALTIRDGGAELGVDVFGSVFFLLTRYEEIVTRERDEHGRFPDAASIAVQSGTHHVPLADMYVELLWDAISSVWPGLTRKDRSYSVTITHDVDLPFACREPTTSILHSAAADLLKRRDPGLAVRRSLLLLRGCDGDHDRDPWNTFDYLMDVSEANGLRSTFNFLAGAADAGTRPYDIAEPWIGRLVQRMHSRGHRIGLHASYGSFSDRARIASEFRRLRTSIAPAVPDQDAWGGRQHFLQWENPGTWRGWEEAELDYDSTLGFAEHVGFRAGTCHSYPVYDLLERRPMRLRERPLIAMDAALSFYMRVPLAKAAALIVDAARTCRQFNGEFVGLWHNSETASRNQQRWYRSLLPMVASPGQG